MHRVLVGIATYFVAGALIMKFHYQSTGTDIIPNKELWLQLPFLVKVMTVILDFHSDIGFNKVMMNCLIHLRLVFM